MTEHWLTKDEEEDIILENYVNASIYCREKKTKGGSVIFVKNNLTYEVIDLRELQKELDFECVAIVISNIIIMAVYRSPDGDVDCFLRNLEIFLNKFSLKNKRIVICGDFNIDFFGKNFRKKNRENQTTIHSRQIRC